MNYQLQATVRWQRTARQIIVLSWLLVITNGLAIAQIDSSRSTAGAKALNVAVQSQRNPPCGIGRTPGTVITQQSGTAGLPLSEEEVRMIMECRKASNQASDKCKELMRKHGFGGTQTFVIDVDCKEINLGIDPPPEKVQEVIKQVLLRVWLRKVRAALAEGRDVNTPDEDGRYLLTGACAGGDFALVKELLSRGARVNPYNSLYGMTPLLAAITSGSTEITRYLLEKGADPNLDKSKQEKTPLHLAVEKELLEPVKLLIAAGADVNVKTAKEGITPLLVAVVSDNLPIAQELIRAKANLNATGANGFTALFIAIYLKRVTMVRTLVMAGADVNTRDQTGVTPLALALVIGNQEIIDLLRSAGAASGSTTAQNEQQLKTAEQYLDSGTAYLQKDNYDLAIQDFSQAILLDPKMTAAYLGRGIAYRRKGDLDRAIQDYSQAISLNPKTAAAYNNRGYAYAEKGDLDRAIQDYNQAIALDPKHVRPYYNRGHAYAKKGDLDRAIQDLTQAISLNPKYAVAYNNRGYVYFLKGDYYHAFQDYNQAISLNPNDAVVYQNRAKAYRALNNNDLADADEKKVQELSGRKPLTQGGLVAVQNAETSETSQKQKPVFCTTTVIQKKAISNQNQEQDEVRFYESHIQTNSQELQLIEPSQVKEVQEVIAEMLKPFPMEEIVQATMKFVPTAGYHSTFIKSCEVEEKGKFAMVAYQISDNRLASVFNGKGLLIGGGMGEISSTLALKYPEKKGDHNSFDFRLIEIDFADSERSKHNGRFFIKGEKWYRIRTSNESVNRGNAHYQKGDFDRAIESYDEAISLDPKSAVAYFNRGLSYSKKQELDRAIADYNQAISLNPRHASAYFARGNAYYEKGDFARAIESYNEAISLSPKSAVVYEKRAKAYRGLGKSDLADADEKKVQELSGKKP